MYLPDISLGTRRCDFIGVYCLVLGAVFFVDDYVNHSGQYISGLIGLDAQLIEQQIQFGFDAIHLIIGVQGLFFALLFSRFTDMNAIPAIFDVFGRTAPSVI
jgi:hypothetical protein